MKQSGPQALFALGLFKDRLRQAGFDKIIWDKGFYQIYMFNLNFYTHLVNVHHIFHPEKTQPWQGLFYSYGELQRVKQDNKVGTSSGSIDTYRGWFERQKLSNWRDKSTMILQAFTKVLRSYVFTNFLPLFNSLTVSCFLKNLSNHALR